jgi:hypothetical protein
MAGWTSLRMPMAILSAAGFIAAEAILAESSTPPFMPTRSPFYYEDYPEICFTAKFRCIILA